MGCCLKAFGLLTILTAVGVGLLFQKINETPDIPELKFEYWAAGPVKPDDKTIKPFKINYPESEVKDLETRLAKTRLLTKPLEGIGFQYGINTNYLNRILTFWKTEYKWKEREVFLNQFPQYKTQISGLNIHFLHVKPAKTEGKIVLPLILLHGWPESVREFYDLIPLLTTSRKDTDFVFEVVVPSLPGYGFSDGAGRPGLGAAQIGVILNILMERLGFKEYYVQGGDWGAAVGRAIAVLYPERVLGYHSNMCLAGSTKSRLQLFATILFPSLFVEDFLQNMFSNRFTELLVESGYFHIQVTKPDTVGVGLTDSPAGLAAYILEKYSTGTNKAWRNLEDGGLEKYDKVALLDNIMIYWFTRSITTSFRLYAESFSWKYLGMNIGGVPVNVPTGCARFPNEPLSTPSFILRSSYLDLVQITDLPRGGHFAAFEVPKDLADDIWSFVKTVRNRPKNNEERSD